MRHSKAVNFLTGEDRSGWFTEPEAKSEHGLRAFPTAEMPHVFQSYHAAADADNYHFLPSGAVGIPPVVGAYRPRPSLRRRPARSPPRRTSGA